MARLCKNRGFSLTEVLIAVGILAVGMAFIAGVFPAGIYLTTIATERTIAAVAADEAFVKIKIYGINLSSITLSDSSLCDFNDVPSVTINDPNEFTYPSTNTAAEKQYCWSALCRLTEAYVPVTNPNPPVQVTVFVSRKVSPNLEYPDPAGSGTVDWPMPVKVGVDAVVGTDNELRIRSRLGAYDDKTYINDGYTIVDNATGRIYRVLERYRDDPGTAQREDAIILLDRDWDADSPNPDIVWVVPPPVGGGRYSCIAVYQKVMRF